MKILSFETANISSIVSEYIEENVSQGINFGVGAAIIGAKLEDRGINPTSKNIFLVTSLIKEKLSKHLEELNKWGV